MCRTGGPRCPKRARERLRQARERIHRHQSKYEHALKRVKAAAKSQDPAKIAAANRALLKAEKGYEDAKARMVAAEKAWENTTCYQVEQEELAKKAKADGAPNRVIERHLQNARDCQARREQIRRASHGAQRTYVDPQTGYTFKLSNKTALNNLSAMKAIDEKQPYVQNRSGQQGFIDNLTFRKYHGNPDLARAEGYELLDQAKEARKARDKIAKETGLSHSELEKTNEMYKTYNNLVIQCTREGNQRIGYAVTWEEKEAGNIKFNVTQNAKAAAALTDSLDVEKRKDRITTHEPGHRKAMNKIIWNERTTKVKPLSETTEIMFAGNTNEGVMAGTTRFSIIEHPDDPNKCIIIEHMQGKQTNTGSNNYGGKPWAKKDVRWFMSEHQDAGSSRGTAKFFFEHETFKLNKDGNPPEAAFKKMRSHISERSTLSGSILKDKRYRDDPKKQGEKLAQTALGTFFEVGMKQREKNINTTIRVGQLHQPFDYDGPVYNRFRRRYETGF